LEGAGDIGSERYEHTCFRARRRSVRI